MPCKEMNSFISKKYVKIKVTHNLGKKENKYESHMPRKQRIIFHAINRKKLWRSTHEKGRRRKTVFKGIIKHE